MKKLFTEGFEFQLFDSESNNEDLLSEKNGFEKVEIPHDWQIKDVNLFYADKKGLYVKKFDVSLKGLDKHIFLRFDGVYMDSTIYLNGKDIFTWKYGYTSFVVELTDYLVEGTNELRVLVDIKNPNSRWYSGAGIYRNIWWVETDEIYIPDGGIYVHSAPETQGIYDKFNITIMTDLSEKWNSVNASIRYSLAEYKGIGEAYCTDSLIELEPIETKFVNDGYTRLETFSINNPKLWDIKEPNLYRLLVKISGDVNQEEELTVGFRECIFTTDKGFFINGRHIKLNGVCEHHDLGSLGAAFYPDAFDRKIDILKGMGVNAIRTSHNPVDPQMYELCDKRGILVLSEAFDMWEMSKTDYDYGRFFKQWYQKDVKRWVLDGRNHPSVFMWSIGNEIPDTHAGPRGREVANNLAVEVKKIDPLGNALVTFGSNYMPWENTQKVADDLKLVGYNYAESFYDDHHEKHPDWIIYGSETSSIVYSRDVYHFPRNAGILSDDDLQCSSLGNSTTSWGASSIEKCIGYDFTKEYSLGQFIWTGFDYIGEPTPYHTKNSYFGQIDTAGFPKDPYYMWKAGWTNCEDNPFIHVFPYWNYNKGQIIDVRVASNAPKVELFLNGISLGSRDIEGVVADYQVAFTPGELKAVAYNSDGNIIAEDSRYSFKDTDSLSIKKTNYGRLSFFEIQAIDCDGHEVSDACDIVTVIPSNGRLLGFDNGDSTDNDSYKSSTRRLFRGKALAIVERTADAIEPTIEAKIENSVIPVRSIVIDRPSYDGKGICLTKDNPSIELKVYTCPLNATNKQLEFKLTDLFGNDSKAANIEINELADGYLVKVTALGDGEYILKSYTNDGYDFVKVMSQLEIKAEGLGTLYINPYEFVPGSVYSRGIGEINNGNERGVSTGRDGDTVIIYDGVDFGEYGTETITIPIFALTDDKYSIRIYQGVPDEADALLICDSIYCKPSIWNVYQEETFKLNKRISGIQTISFRIIDKVHFKGFSCKEINPIYEKMWAGRVHELYGDQFELKGDCVENIGNNVTIGFGKLSFEDGVSKVNIYGKANKGTNTLHIRLNNGTETIKEVVQFPESEDYTCLTFDINSFKGVGELSVIFMPGSDFNLGYIQFER